MQKPFHTKIERNNPQLAGRAVILDCMKYRMQELNVQHTSAIKTERNTNVTII